MVNRKPVYIVAGLVAILGMIAISSSGNFSAFAQGSEVKVDIVPGGSTKSGPQAYSVDPIKVRVGGKVDMDKQRFSSTYNNIRKTWFCRLWQRI